MNSLSIGEALFTKTQQRVLGLLYGKPDKSFYNNDIVRRANIGRGTVRRELDRLVSVGLLVVSYEGNQHHYKANEANPIYKELTGIVRKTFGIADKIKDALLIFDKEIKLAFVYGSIPKGKESASSDIDLLVVANTLAYSELMLGLSKAEESLGRPINPTIYTMAQFKSKLKKGNAFLVKVMEQEKIWLKGGEDDIREFG